MDGLGIRAMTEGELAGVLGWAAAEGWNPGTGDAAPFHAADPEGFLLAEAAGEAVGAVSVARHDAAAAFLGLFLVRPDWRGRGVGRALWEGGLAHAGGRSVGLDGVAAQEGRYARAGFVRAGATIRFEGGHLAAAPGLRPARADDVDALVALDRAAFGIVRERFLRAWLAPAPDRGTIVLADGAGRPLGFATARACGRGRKVGPVVAPDLAAALSLAAAGPLKGPTAIDVPEGAALGDALSARGYRETFRTARMWRGPAPRGDGTGWAIATMELG